MMHTLIIKGTVKDAFAAADYRGVELTSIVQHPKFEECICTTNTKVEDLMAWFLEDTGEAPYPVGTLTWYGERPEPEK